MAALYLNIIVNKEDNVSRRDNFLGEYVHFFCQQLEVFSLILMTVISSISHMLSYNRKWSHDVDYDGADKINNRHFHDLYCQAHCDTNDHFNRYLQNISYFIQSCIYILYRCLISYPTNIYICVVVNFLLSPAFHESGGL